jgi:hypothetical protein
VIRDAAAALRSLAEAATDASGYFPALYARVTEHIARDIDEGRFAQPERLDRLATVFAQHCLDAYADAAGRPRCWQACFDVAGDGGLLIVQQLLLGINAHINHDLPLAVVELAQDGDLESIRPDFEVINDVLTGMTSTVLRQLDRVSCWVNTATSLGGGRLFNFSLRVARGQAWGAAGRLRALPDAAAREAYRAELDELVSVLAYLVTQPSPLLRPVLWLARAVEEHDTRKVVAALLSDR